MATQSTIEQLYLDNLGRAASDEEKSYWSGYSGDASAAIKASPEAKGWNNQSIASSSAAQGQTTTPSWVQIQNTSTTASGSDINTNPYYSGSRGDSPNTTVATTTSTTPTGLTSDQVKAGYEALGLDTSDQAGIDWWTNEWGGNVNDFSMALVNASQEITPTDTGMGPVGTPTYTPPETTTATGGSHYVYDTATGQWVDQLKATGKGTSAGPPPATAPAHGYTMYSQTDGVSPAAIVENWYKNQFGRVGSQAGLDWWTDRIEEEGGDYSSVFDEFIQAGVGHGEEKGLYDSGNYYQDYFNYMNQGGYEGGTDPGEFTGNTWQELQAWNKNKAAYDVAQYMALNKQLEEVEETPSTSVVDQVASGVTPVSEQYQGTRVDYYTSLMRNDPAGFQKILVKAQETNPALYNILSKIQQTEIDRKEGLMSSGPAGFQSRISVLEQMKATNPDAYTSVMTAMQNKNPELFAVLTDFMGGTNGS